MKFSRFSYALLMKWKQGYGLQVEANGLSFPLGFVAHGVKGMACVLSSFFA